MLHRATSEGTVVIGQPAHAWSRARSPAPGPTPSRRGRRCLAAEQHDIAWIGWERTPERDPETGLPYAFSALPRLRRLYGGAQRRSCCRSPATPRCSSPCTARSSSSASRRRATSTCRASGYLEHERAFQARIGIAPRRPGLRPACHGGQCGAEPRADLRLGRLSRSCTASPRNALPPGTRWRRRTAIPRG